MSDDIDDERFRMEIGLVALLSRERDRGAVYIKEERELTEFTEFKKFEPSMFYIGSSFRR